MSRFTLFAPDEFYHIYNRGTDRRAIFTSEADYTRFTTLLYAMNTTNTIRLNNEERRRSSLSELFEIERECELVSIVGYCLMPNHYHLIVKERDPCGISKFMQKLSTAYSMYFNKRYDRSGVLFQGKFKAKHVSDDRYLKYIFSYIHLNPVDLMQADWQEIRVTNINKTQEFLNNYKYSSYIDYRGVVRPENAILHVNAAPRYHMSLEELENEVTSWLQSAE